MWLLYWAITTLIVPAEPPPDPLLLLPPQAAMASAASGHARRHCSPEPGQPHDIASRPSLVAISAATGPANPG